jgi:signal transduction histidine kinase
MNDERNPRWLERRYWDLFNFFAAPGQKHHPVRAYKLHSLLLTFTISQIFMGFFAFFGARYIDSTVMTYGPFICVAVSWLGLLAYRLWHNIFLASNIFLFSLSSYTFIFCWCIDGFRKTNFAWFALIPIAAGMLTNRLYTFAWSLVVILLTGLGYWASIEGLAINLLTDKDHITLSIIQQLGFLFSIGLITLFILHQQKVVSDYLREKVVSKQNLLRILVHDISTPLTIMRMTGQMLANGQKVDPQVAGLKIDKNAEQMSNIISLIRDMESWEAHHKSLPATPIELVSLLDQVVELYNNRLVTKGIHVAKFYSSEVYVLGHETMLVHQVFGNLLSNAIKFSTQQSRIEIGIEPLSAHQVSVVIRDYGIGIPLQTRKDLFDPFALTMRIGTAGEKGTGLGLPITKNCVELLGGMIVVASRTKEENPQDHGTSITVILKRAPQI